MDQQTIVERLVEQHYHFHHVLLRSLYPQTSDGWGLYTVEADNGHAYVLRAYRYDDVEATLLRQVAVLHYLEQHGHPAPRVVPTKMGFPLVRDEHWSILLHTFIAGKTADFSWESLILLGKTLASLHTQTEPLLAEKDVVLPDSRLRPTQAMHQALMRTSSTMPSFPPALQPFCTDVMAAGARVLAATALPTTLLHGDCWPQNAIRTDDGRMTMIDWDCAGVGPAILDVGYLLVACHLGKPQLPVLKPDARSIAAVVHGYCQQRKLRSEELDLLLPVLRYLIAQRALLEDRLLAFHDHWQEDIRLQRVLARYAASEEIACIASHCFTSQRP